MEPTEQQPEQTEGNQPINTQPPQEFTHETPFSSFNWKRVFLTILGIILVAGIGFGGYYLGTRKSVNTPYQHSQPTSMQIQPSPTTSTSNMQTYVNSIDSYSFQYPIDWDVVVLSQLIYGSNEIMVAPQKIADDAKQKVKTNTIPEVGFDSVLSIQPDTHDSSQFVSNRYQTVTQKPVTVAGTTGTEYTVTFTQSVGFAKAGDIGTTVLFNHSDKKWMISLNDHQYQSIFDQLVASFQFVDPSTINSPSQIRRYYNTKSNVGILFDYPADAMIKEQDNSQAGQFQVFVKDSTLDLVADVQNLSSGISKNYLGTKPSETITVTTPAGPLQWDVLPNSGYCDAGSCGKPFIAYQVFRPNTNYRYVFVFNGTMQKTQTQIDLISTFRFVN